MSFFLQIYFLQRPTIDFGLGGLASAAELPVIRSLFRLTLEPHKYLWWFGVSRVVKLDPQGTHNGTDHEESRASKQVDHPPL